MSQNEENKSQLELEGNQNFIIMTNDDVKTLITALCNQQEESIEKLVEQFRSSNTESINYFKRTIDAGFEKVCETLKDISTTKKPFYENIKTELKSLHKTLREDVQQSINSSFDKIVASQSQRDHNVGNNLTIPSQQTIPTSNEDNITNTYQVYIANHEREVRKNFNKRKMKIFQVHRAESLSNYYKTLINREAPFVPSKFRVNVNDDARRGEIKIRKECSIKNVENECRVMDQNINEWKEEIKTIEKDTIKRIGTLTENKQKDSIMKTWHRNIKSEEDKSIKIWQKSMDIIKRRHNQEITEGGELIITFSKPKVNSTLQDNFNNNQDFRHRPRYSDRRDR